MNRHYTVSLIVTNVTVSGVTEIAVTMMGVTVIMMIKIGFCCLCVCVCNQLKRCHFDYKCSIDRHKVAALFNVLNNNSSYGKQTG